MELVWSDVGRFDQQTAEHPSVPGLVYCIGREVTRTRKRPVYAYSTWPDDHRASRRMVERHFVSIPDAKAACAKHADTVEKELRR